MLESNARPIPVGRSIVPMTSRSFRFLAALCGASALGATVASAAPLRHMAVHGGTFTASGDQAAVWANSPQARFHVDNRRFDDFAGVTVAISNVVAGTYLATPEGVVAGSSRDGKRLDATLTVPPQERQTWTLHPNVSGSYRFALMGQTASADGSQAMLGKLAKRLEGEKVAFALHTGGLVHRPSPPVYDLVRAQLATFPFPTYALPGSRDASRRADWRAHFGEPVTSFAVAGDRFILLDAASGRLGEQGFKTLASELAVAQEAKARHVFVALHTPPVDPRPGLNDALPTSEARRLYTMLREAKITLLLAGKVPVARVETRFGVRTALVAAGARAARAIVVSVSDQGAEAEIVSP